MRYQTGLIIGVMAVALAGCSQLSEKVPGLSGLPGVGTVVKQRVTEEMFAHITDPILKKHMVAQANAAAFRIKSTSSGMSAGLTQVNEMELEGDDYKMSSWEENNGAKTNELIMMGDTTYLKDYKDNSWWKQTATKEELETNVADEVVQEPLDFKDLYGEVKNTVSYENLGEEACGTLTCYKYKEVDSTNPEGARTFWFDTKDYLLRQEQNAFGEFTSTAEYTYDGINIKAPSPTKEVPQGKSIYEYMVYEGAGLSDGQKQELEAAQAEVKKMQEDIGAGRQPEVWQPPETTDSTGEEYSDY